LEQTEWQVEAAEGGRNALVKTLELHLVVIEMRLLFLDGYDLLPHLVRRCDVG